MRKIILLFLFLLAHVSTVQAGEIRPYIGSGFGMFGLELQTPTVNQKNSVIGEYIKLGADFNDYLAAEVRFGSTGKGTSSYPVGTLIATSFGTFPSPIAFDFSMSAEYFFSYLLKPQYELAEGVHLYGLLGGSTVKVRGDFSVASIPGFDGVVAGYSYGVGGEYRLTEHLHAGVEWVQYLTDVTAGKNSTARIWGIVGAVKYSF